MSFRDRLAVRAPSLPFFFLLLPVAEAVSSPSEVSAAAVDTPAAGHWWLIGDGEAGVTMDCCIGITPKIPTLLQRKGFRDELPVLRNN